VAVTPASVGVPVHDLPLSVLPSVDVRDAQCVGPQIPLGPDDVVLVAHRGDDEDVLLLHRSEIQAVLAEPDLVPRLRAQAAFMTPVFRRIGPLLVALRGAAGSEQAAADLLGSIRRVRKPRCRSP
jgi:hypothetical protein